MFCTKCGQQNPDGAKFCRACGAPLSPAVAMPGAGPAAANMQGADVPGPNAYPTSSAAPGLAPQAAPAPVVHVTLAKPDWMQGDVVARVVVCAMVAVTLLVSLNTGWFRTGSDTLRASNATASVVGGLSDFSSALGGSSYDSDSLRLHSEYTLSNLHEFFETVANYDELMDYSSSSAESMANLYSVVPVIAIVLGIGAIVAYAVWKSGIVVYASMAYVALVGVMTPYIINSGRGDLDATGMLVLSIALAVATIVVTVVCQRHFAKKPAK